MVMKPVAGKKVAVFSALGAAVTIFAALFWTDCLVQYHLVRLRHDAAYLMAIVDEPMGGSVRRAIDIFMEDDNGRVAVLQSYVGAIMVPSVNRVMGSRQLGFADVEEGWFRIDPGKEDTWYVCKLSSTAVPSGHIVQGTGLDLEGLGPRFVALRNLLQSLVGTRVALRCYPGIQFCILTGEKASEVSTIRPDSFRPTELLCFVRRIKRGIGAAEEAR